MACGMLCASKNLGFWFTLRSCVTLILRGFAVKNHLVWKYQKNCVKTHEIVVYHFKMVYTNIFRYCQTIWLFTVKHFKISVKQDF